MEKILDQPNLKLKAIVYCLLQLTVIASFAQVNRRNTKSTVSYRENYQRLSTGKAHTLEIRDGTLWAWGNNSTGQLGDGTIIDKFSPIQIGLDNKWIIVSAGKQHSLAIKVDGTLWAWGENSKGQLGDGTNLDKNSPTQIGFDKNWISVAAGESFSLGLKSDGTLWAWGLNASGQLGDGTNIDKNIPIQIGNDNNWTSIASGRFHSLSLKSNGTLWAWGDNSNGQLGDGTNSAKYNPVQIGNDNNWKRISCNEKSSHGLKANGTLWAWGWNLLGQLGDGTNTDQNSPIQIEMDNNWVNFASGSYHSLGLKSDGTLWVWGDNASGQLGNGTTISNFSPTQIGNDNKWVSVYAGDRHSFGLKADGTLWAWGNNFIGQLGDGTNTIHTSPIKIGIDNKWLDIVGGLFHSLGLKTDGTIWGWGDNSSGQLGDGTNLSQNSQIKIGTDNKWISICAGEKNSLGLKSDGTLWAWGENIDGQLGDGTNLSKNSPVQIGNDNNWISISSGTGHSLGIKSNGTLWAWGKNSDGQLGDGTYSATNSPIQIGIDTKWVCISTGNSSSLGLKSDGTLWAWGSNAQGQLGDGTNIGKNSPVQIGTDNSWVDNSQGVYHSLGLKSDGTLWAWGFNSDGQLGDGTTIPKNSPIQIGNVNLWSSISSGGYHNHGLKSDGTLWAWGFNASGQLGDGTNSNNNNPIQIGSDNNWIRTSNGQYYSMGLKSDRIQHCATGQNNKGQLGVCNFAYQSNFLCSDLPITILSYSTNKIICAGSFASFFVITTNEVSYQWQENINGIWYNLSDVGVYSGTSSDTMKISSASVNFNNRYYRCILSNVGVCPPPIISDSAKLSVFAPLANISTANGSTTFCKGDNFILSANTGNGYTYKWYQNGNLLTGRTSDTLSIKNGGSYSVEVTISTNCYTTSSVINISSITKPSAYITATGSTSICDGSFVTLQGNSGSGLSRQWQLNGIDIPNAIFVNFAADSSGVYTLKVTNSLGCDSISNAIQVTVLPYPTATISYSGPPFTCTGNTVLLHANLGVGYTYQWTKSGVPILNATDSVYAATGAGEADYTVVVTNAGICSSTSAAVKINPIPATPSICIVTVDSTSTNNIIYWEKTPGTTNIESFYVYRDTSNNNFALIGIVPYDSLSLFVDTVRHLYDKNGDPNASTWRYKLAMKDSCGVVGPKSLFHQTNFLVNNNGNFQWTQYQIEGQGLPVSQLTSYKFFRDSISSGNWKIIQPLSASSSVYVDGNYNSYPNGRWKVEAGWSSSCDPTLRTAAGVTTSRSNIKNRCNLDTSIVQNGNVLQATVAGANYQWLDCTNSFASLPGQTGQFYFNAPIGVYAVRINAGVCTDTSRCISILDVFGISTKSTSQIKLIPNPAKETVSVISDLIFKEIRIIDVLGRIALSKLDADSKEKNTRLDISMLVPGVYTVICKGSDFEVQKKLVVE